MSVTNEYTEISTAAGYFYRLGTDHIRSFTTDPQRSIDGLNHAFLQLHVQLYIQGPNVTARPNSKPGEPVPPLINPALKARAAFVPELERTFRRQVEILDRVIVNFSATANELLGGHTSPQPGDTWESLRPIKQDLFPHVAIYRDLSASDTELLSEFYGAVREVSDLIGHWTGTMTLKNYNAWNVLMHKVEQSLRVGELAVQKLCPNRSYDETIPTAGSLLSQSKRSLTQADKARTLFIEKSMAKQKSFRPQK